jgi:hypothetical protein
MDNKVPILAIPTWGEKARVPKLHIVVRLLNRTARDVLDCNTFPAVGGAIFIL